MIEEDEFTKRTGIKLTSEEELDAAAITPEVYSAWRAPRRGTSNPERMDNPLWDWLARTGINARAATRRFGGPSSREAGPAWCFDRFGQPGVKLADGRIVIIAGEHEDHYDPDFYIYNDVVVHHPDGRLEFFGYPEADFPPTDFHTATLIAGRIVLIGNLGYPEQRLAGTTQVAVLALDTWVMRLVTCLGEPPEWLHRHRAEPAGDGLSILISGGMLDPVGTADASLKENIDDWRLWLDEWRWERVTRRQWPRREVLRRDRKRLQLWELEQASAGLGQLPELLDLSILEHLDSEEERMELRRLLEDCNATEEDRGAKLREQGLNPDRMILESLMVPATPHRRVEGDDEWRVTRIEVNGVIVRYKDVDYSIQMIVEGDLPPETVKALTDDLLVKLEKLQGASCEARPL